MGNSSSGMLRELLRRSVDVFSTMLDGRDSSNETLSLDRTIVHADPHLDEYVADLIFRASLPQKYWTCEFVEQAIFSTRGDTTSRLLWPSAAVFGIGSDAVGGVQPLFLFDEHVAGDTKIASSCCAIVADRMLRSKPEVLLPILREVDVIDEYGGAHPQHLHNLLKTLHNVRFVLGTAKDGSGTISDFLSAQWKQIVVHASVATVAWCLRENNRRIYEPDAAKNALSGSLDNYVRHSPHVNATDFEKTIQRIRSVFGDQAKVAADAVLRKGRDVVRDDDGQPVGQLLTLGRICVAAEVCWGENARDVIATHFWESEVQKQLNFLEVQRTVERIHSSKSGRTVSNAGTVTLDVLDPVDVEVQNQRSSKREKRRQPVWVITMAARPHVFQPNQALMYHLNQRNAGCGVVLIRNTTIGTCALFAGSSIADVRWERLVNLLSSVEEECWHVVRNPNGGIAPFVLNGNRAHQYVPRSNLDRASLVEVVRKAFY